MNAVLTPLRVIFGLWMLVSGLNHFTGNILPVPVGTEPLAVQFIEAVRFSRLYDVAMAIQLVCGALVLAGLFVPLALAVVMPVNVCALYWALVLERDPAWGAAALLAVAMGAVLMLAHLVHYRAMLERRPLALGESDEPGGRYEGRYADPVGQLTPARFAIALVPLAGAVAFFQFIVPGILAFSCLIVLLWPLTVLSLRLLQYLLRDPERHG